MNLSGKSRLCVGQHNRVNIAGVRTGGDPHHGARHGTRTTDSRIRFMWGAVSFAPGATIFGSRPGIMRRKGFYATSRCSCKGRRAVAVLALPAAGTLGCSHRVTGSPWMCSVTLRGGSCVDQVGREYCDGCRVTVVRRTSLCPSYSAPSGRPSALPCHPPDNPYTVNPDIAPSTGHDMIVVLKYAGFGASRAPEIRDARS